MDDGYRKSRAFGFSLVELLVVLTIAGLAVTLSRPVYEAAMPGAKLRAEARDLATALRESASMSILRGREITVSFDGNLPGYAVDGRNVTVLESNFQILVGASDNGAFGVDNDPAGPVLLHFYPDGSSNGASIDLTGAGRAYRVRVDWLTGEIRLEERDGADG